MLNYAKMGSFMILALYKHDNNRPHSGEISTLCITLLKRTLFHWQAIVPLINFACLPCFTLSTAWNKRSLRIFWFFIREIEFATAPLCPSLSLHHKVSQIFPPATEPGHSLQEETQETTAKILSWEQIYQFYNKNISKSNCFHTDSSIEHKIQVQTTW